MSTYRYHTLAGDEGTRLVCLKPAKDLKDELVCELINVPLGLMPKFDALSYVWRNSAHRTPDQMTQEQKDDNGTVATYDGEKSTTYSVNWEEMGASEIEEVRCLYYQLGGERKDGTILLDNHAFPVGFELEEAMRRLRYLDEERLVWIDAICINQTDVAERNVHVKRMGEIYSRADTVIIWLGEYVPQPDLALGVLDMLAKKIPEYVRKTQGNIYGSIKDAFLNDPEIRKAYWEQFAQFLRRAWFSRVWVLQEVVNAKKAVVYASHYQLPWDYFAGLINWLRDNDVDHPLLASGSLACIPTIQMIVRLTALKNNPKGSRPPRLLDVLQDSRSTKSTYHIDKVYGILGMISEAEAATIEVNYNLGPAELFTKIATTELGKGLEILSFCSKASNASEVRCPSWVPDWTQPCHHFPFSTIRMKIRGYSSGNSTPKFKIDGETLVLKGRVVDTIDIVESYLEIPKGSKPRELRLQHPERFFNNVKPEEPERFSVETMFIRHLENTQAQSMRWLQSAISIAFPTGEMTKDSYDALWRTFCWNTTSDGAPIPHDYADYFSPWVKAIMGTADGTHADNMEWTCEDGLRAMRFDQVFGEKCYNRRFFRTVEGRFGWAPDQAKAGDKVCIFDGAPVPFVIRSVNQDCFELIGDGYLHGVMNGEAMGLKEEEIRLV